MALALVSVVACSGGGTNSAEAVQPPSPPTLSAGEVESEVRAFVEHYNETLSRREPDAVRSLYVADERFRWFEQGELRYRSASDVIASLASFPSDMEISTELSSIEVDPLSESFAVATALFETRIAGADGADFQFSGAMTMVVERTSDGWKIVSGHTSTPPA